MKIALISLDKETTDPPLGLAYISSYLKKYLDFHDIDIINSGDFLKKIEEKRYNIIGISAVTTEFKEANELAKQIKTIYSPILIVGGKHISLVPKHLEESVFDIGVIGEGEQTMLELVRAIKKNKNLNAQILKGIPGLVFKNEKGKLDYSEPRQLISNLDDIPYPDRDKLDMVNRFLVPRIIGSVDYIAKVTTLFTSRGCPYNCSFCSSQIFWNNVRFNSAEYVVGEIELLIKKYKVDWIHIHDDLFVAKRKRVKKIVKLLDEKNLLGKVNYSLLARSNLITEDLLKDLKNLGVIHIGFGFESGSERMLKQLKKSGISLAEHKKAIELCKKYDFLVTGSFIFGSPNETKEDLEKTIDFIKESSLYQFNVNQLIPFPGTEVWDYAKKIGLVNDSFDFVVNKLSNLYVHEFNPSGIISQDISLEDFKKKFFEAQKMVVAIRNKRSIFKLRNLKYLANWKFMNKLVRRRSIMLKYINRKSS